jgi:hypothetical protein
MTRVRKIAGFAAPLAALWTVTGADWPVDDVIAFLGGIPCC